MCIYQASTSACGIANVMLFNHVHMWEAVGMLHECVYIGLCEFVKVNYAVIYVG